MAEQYMNAYTSKIDRLYQCGGTLDYAFKTIKDMEDELAPQDVMYLKSYARKHEPKES